MTPLGVIPGRVLIVKCISIFFAFESAGGGQDWVRFAEAEEVSWS